MSEYSKELPDVPILKQDFQNSAVHRGYHPRVGSRLFGDINLRGWLFDVARARKQGREFTDADYQRLGSYPLAILDIYYLGEEVPQNAISLNGLRSICDLDLLGTIIILPKNNTTRIDIIEDVITTKTLEQIESTPSEVV
jgi:hypothetical protein